MKELSKRGKEWNEFSEKVLNHIENYTVPQYGDMGIDNATTMQPVEFISNIKRYCKRFGKNQRENQEGLDFFKIAHYSCLAYNKIDKIEEKIYNGNLKDIILQLKNDFSEKQINNLFKEN